MEILLKNTIFIPEIININNGNQRENNKATQPTKW